MKYAQLVIGPAGCGKSTYCNTIQQHCDTIGRSCRVVNLDPAADAFLYSCSLDIRDMISVDEVMKELSLGPNGGLITAMEFILSNMDIVEEEFDSFVDEDFILIDCPGQIELYSHMPLMRHFVDKLNQWEFQVVAIYCIDVSFLTDAERFVAGALAALSAMVRLEIPHVNVLTKLDILPSNSVLDKLLDREPAELLSELRRTTHPKYQTFNESIISVLEEFSLVGFACLNREDEESIQHVLMLADHAIQFGENAETKANYDMDGNGEGEDDDQSADVE